MPGFVVAVVDAALARLFRVKRAVTDDDLRIIYMPPQKADLHDHVQKHDEDEKFRCNCG